MPKYPVPRVPIFIGKTITKARKSLDKKVFVKSA